MSRNERHIQTDGLDHEVRWAKDSVLPRLFQTGRATADENAFLRSFVSGISRELRKNNGTSVLGRCQFIFPKDVDRPQANEEWEDKKDFDRLPSAFGQLSGQSTVCELETDEDLVAIRFKVEEREVFSYVQDYSDPVNKNHRVLFGMFQIPS